MSKNHHKEAYLSAGQPEPDEPFPSPAFKPWDEAAPYTARTLKWAHVNQEGWMGEFATMIEIDDEGAGEFLLLTQPFAHTKLANGGIAINPDEWPTLRALLDAAFGDIAKHAGPES